MADTPRPQAPPVPEPTGSVTLVEGTGGPVPAADNRSLADLLKELTQETTTLVRQEVQLAKTEAREELREAGRDIGAMVAGGALAYTGLIALVIGLGWGLGELFGGEEWLGITIVGALVALVGYLMLKKGLDKLQRLSPPLDTTQQTLKEDKQWLKEQTP